MDLSFLWPLVECLGVIVFAMGGYPCCCKITINCTHCENQVGPLEFSVAISGVVDNTCTGCNSVNGTYIVEFVTSCQWEKEITALDGSCSLSDGVLRVTMSSFDIIVGMTGGFPFGMSWRRFQAAPHDCFSQGINIPFNAQTTECDASGSTCTIAAVP